MNTIRLQPAILDTLRKIGQSELSVEHGRARLSADVSSIAAFTDLAGDDAHARYRVAGSYVRGWNTSAPLASRLHEIRSRHGVPERTIDYKSRRDRLVVPLLHDWFGAFSEEPGILLLQAWDKTGLPRSADDFRKLRESLVTASMTLKPGTAERIAFAISFFACIGHLIRRRDRVVWVSDRDAIFEASRREVLSTALTSIANEVFAEPPQAFGYAQWFADEVDDPDTGPFARGQRLMLSLPDLTAGALARYLPVPFGSKTLELDDDPGAAAILAGLARLAGPNSACKVLIVVWRANPRTGCMEPRLVSLSAPS